MTKLKSHRETLDHQFEAHAAELSLQCDVFSTGPVNAEVVIIGEGPGESEVRQGVPFIGGAGSLLFNALRKHGLTRANVYLTNVVKRQISLSRKGNEKHIVYRDELEKWKGMLNWELSQLPNARIFFVLGNYALEAITQERGILNWRGSVIDLDPSLHGRKGKAVITINPAYALREPKMEPMFLMDCHKLSQVVNGTFKPHLVEAEINPTARRALDFIRELSASPKPIAYDIETINGETACHGLGNSPHRAMCINLRDGSSNRFSVQEEADILLALQALCDSHKIIAQNGAFDAYWTRLHDWLSIRVWFDTLLAHHTLYPQLPHSLAFLCTQYTTHPFYKDEGKNWREGGDIDQFWKYNCLTGDTKILHADLTWKRLDEVTVGDNLLSFDEHGRKRRLRRSMVIKVAASKRPVMKVIFDDGTELRGTSEHKIVRTRSNKQGSYLGPEWVELGMLRPYDLIPSLDMWEPEYSYEAGWLAGLFDGEGTVWTAGVSQSPRVGFSQKEGPILENAKMLLNKRGFRIGISTKAGASYADIQGGLAETLRFLGQIRPMRLRANTFKRIDTGWGGFSQLRRKRVMYIIPDGEEVVYDITTTTGTFLANGIIAHNCTDVAITIACAEAQQRELKAQHLDKFFFSHVMRAQPHLVSATVHGLRVDTALKNTVIGQCNEDVERRKAEFYRLVHELTDDKDYFPNPNSPKQLSDLFFNVLELRGRGQSTDKANRESIAKNPHTPTLAKDMLVSLDRYLTEAKFTSTFAESKLGPDNRYRCEYKQYGVARAPGRLSSAQLLDGQGGNLQNQPVRARAQYIADPGCVFVYFDLAQAEARIVAWRAKIEKWKEQFEQARIDQKYDAHRALASEMFKVPYDRVPVYDFLDAHNFPPGHPKCDEATLKPTIRYIAKRCRHGLNYRMERWKLAEVTGLPIAQAAKAWAIYHSTTPELRHWWDRAERDFKRTREAHNALGRRLKVIQRIDDDVLASIVAFYPQSTVGDKVTQVWYQAEEDPAWPSTARVCLNVHDNLVAQCEPDEAIKCLRILKKYAEEPILIQDVYGNKPEPLIIPAELKMSYPTIYDPVSGKFKESKKGFHRWSHMKEVRSV